MIAGRPRTFAFAFYLVTALLTVGWYAVSDPSHVCACDGDADTTAFMWGLGWWPHALVHGLNPFVSHYLFAPTGVNVARAAMIPAAAIVLSPVTALWGPLVSYNVLAVASPVLAAFTAYLLCRHIVGRELPALAGGYLFGFGNYVLARAQVHANLTLVFLIPVAVLLVLRRLDRQISRRAYIGVLAALLVVQMGLSTEVLVTALAMAAAMLVAARFLAAASYGKRIDHLLGESLIAGLIAAALTAPFLYYALIKGGVPSETGLAEGGMDLLNPIIPTHLIWLGHETFAQISATMQAGNFTEADGYLTVPLALAFLWWVARSRRRLLARLVAIAAVVSFIASLGAHVHVAGVQTLALPYNWVAEWPIVRLLGPSRIAVYTSLAVAVGMAAWLAERPARRVAGAGRWLAVLLGMVLLFPYIGSHRWGTPPNVPALFRTSAYRRYLQRDETVLVLPMGIYSNSALWQAMTGFYFRMPEGYIARNPPPQFIGLKIDEELATGNAVNPSLLASFLRSHDVRHILIEQRALSYLPLTRQLYGLGFQTQAAGEMSIFRVPAGWN